MVRVIIERWLREDAEAAFVHEMRGMRGGALAQRGYVSGETWRDAANPRHVVVLSTWKSRDAWDAWETSEARGRALAAIRPLLAAGEKVTVLEPI
jgi:heme-degrading monooxygenase HmoA